MYIDAEDLAAGALFTFQGVGTPGDGVWLGSQPFPVAITFAADFAGVFADVLPASLPTATSVFTIKSATSPSDTGTTVGTVTMATDGTVTGDTSGLEVDFAAMTSMRVYCPDPADATLADFALSFPASVG